MTRNNNRYNTGLRLRRWRPIRCIDFERFLLFEFFSLSLVLKCRWAFVGGGLLHFCIMETFSTYVAVSPNYSCCQQFSQCRFNISSYLIVEPSFECYLLKVPSRKLNVMMLHWKRKTFFGRIILDAFKAKSHGILRRRPTSIFHGTNLGNYKGSKSKTIIPCKLRSSKPKLSCRRFALELLAYYIDRASSWNAFSLSPSRGF